jgi:asparagine synthase (glutamine-hydrolysing)
MCGIAGLVGPAAAPTRSELAAMIGALQHRGPDGTGLYCEGPVGLAHSRLSIIDLAGGHQPIHNEDQSVWVVFNGEIFNYLELRAELERAGHRFYTHSDTEVIVHLYEEHGDEFVQHLNGQFAIALHDRQRQRVLLARDRVGIRPLFYAEHAGRLAFASEVKALFALPALPRRMSTAALGQVFSFWATLPPHTAFEGVLQLPPGHLMVVDVSGDRLHTQTRCYWDWQFPEEPVTRPRSEAECAEELHALMVDAVRLQLRADVPVGAYLSGGLDSSVITALIRNHTATPLRSFSLTFEDSEFDERPHQQALVAHLGTEHSELRASRAGIAAHFARTVWHAETPLVRTGPTPLMMLAGHVRASGYKVVLTGEGADEIFGGYDLFKEAKLRRFVARQPQSRWRGRLIERLYPYLQHSPTRSRGLSQQFFNDGPADPQAPWAAHATRLRSTQRVWQFLRPELQDQLARWDAGAALAAHMPAGSERWLPMGRDQYLEAHTLLSGYLLSSQGDRMAMAHSIEARFPFLDHRVIEFANRLPAHYKLRGLNEKYILKRAMQRELPASITERSKQPYRAPDSASFIEAGRLRPWVAELLSPERLNEAGLFDATAVHKLIDKCCAGRAIGFPDNMAFVGVLSTMLVHTQFVRPATPQALQV